MPDNGGKDSGLPASLATTVALVVAGLAAIGLSGDALLRAVRNHTLAIAVSLIVALVAATVFAVAQLWPPSGTGTTIKKTRTYDESAGTKVEEVSETPPKNVFGTRSRFIAGALTALAGALSFAIGFGAEAVDDREAPSLTVQLGQIAGATAGPPEQSGFFEVTVTAKASSMTTKNDLLVQVIGIRSGWPQSEQTVPSADLSKSEEVIPVCEYNHGPRGYTAPIPAGVSADVLLWNRVGPSADGEVDASWKLQVPAAHYQVLCAWSIFGSQLTDLNERLAGLPVPEQVAVETEEQVAEDKSKEPVFENSAFYLVLPPGFGAPPCP